MRTISRPRSMFTCLYLESLVGLIIALLAFVVLSKQFIEENEIERFVQQGQNQIDHLIQQSDPTSNLISYSNLQSMGYRVTLLDGFEELVRYCKSCVLISRTEGVNVFRTPQNMLAGVYLIPGSNQQLLLEQTIRFESSDSLAVHLSFPLFITMSIALGFLLYLPLYRVNKRINRLIATQEKFGMGELSARSEIYDISPVKELATSFNNMAQDIEQRVKQNQIFYHAIPHEIRTPLSRIQMAVDLLRRGDTKEKPALFNQVDKYIMDIADLTTDILKLAHLTDRKCEGEGCSKQMVDLFALCDERVQRSASNCHAEICIDIPHSNYVVEVTPALAKLVLDNLLKNADKYGRSKVKVSINQYDCCLTIDIEDDGNGIPENKRQDIFIAFARLDQSRASHTGGFGLGLAIANSAAKHLGWVLSVDDSSLGGARFTVMIPKS
ncbi:ATP-binding protein [Vibrio sp. LaRot3]|uniref:ATP-binding protein n=1 Tax=Vibrio sp. LaRot3 TaxID=2998829 RepID=UPI0022CDE10B|nr:ATP-binding protein [Vibrio sp. LaRot3]MDA0148215.1 ATP-binding protein [Vibrio sp. LaRot3]